MMTRTVLSLVALAIIPSLTPGSANAIPIPLEAFLPDFSAATFETGAPINNSYFPILDQKRVFVGQKEEDGEIVTERFVLTNAGPGPTILGVQTTAQRDRSFEEGLLVEDTFDYFAQDTAGNVWYFGEDVTNFIYDDEGNLIETTDESAWKAGFKMGQPCALSEPGCAHPGYIMPAELIIGFNYYQEFAPLDDALDQGTIVATGLDVSVGIGDFTDVLRILETNQLEPDAREFKYYAPELGLILVEEDLDMSLQNPELTFELVSVIPEPAPFMLLGLGLAVIAYQNRKKVDDCSPRHRRSAPSRAG